MEQDRDQLLRSFVSLLSAKQKSPQVPIHQLQELFDDQSEDVTNCLRTCCSLPSLYLLRNSDSKKRNGPGNPSSRRRIQESCAEMMSAPCHFTYDTLSSARKVLLDNISQSFRYLVKARIANSIKAFISQSSATQIHKKVFVQMLTKPTVKPVELTTIETMFQPAVFCEGTRVSNSDGVMIDFLVMMHVRIMGDLPFTVRFKVSGSCSDLSTGSLLKHVRVILDTELLLQQMITQARLVAKKALKIAADAAQFYISGLSSSNASLVSMSSSEGSDLSRLDDDTMPPPPRRLKSKK